MTAGALAGAIIGALVEGVSTVVERVQANDVDGAKRRAREAADRAVDKAFALWRLAERRKKKAEAAKKKAEAAEKKTR